MSKRAANRPPLILHSVPNPVDDNYHVDNSTDQETPRRSDFLRPTAAGSNSTSQRESNSSDAQYAVAPASTQYLDLPSTVPFQHHFQLTPALPSADFPSSARDFVSPPDTSSSTDFPTPSPSIDPSVASYYYTSPEGPRLSNASTTSDQSDRRADQNANPAISVSAALSRADSMASYNSAWTGEGSEQHLTLDIAQFPRPPQTDTSVPEEPSQSRTSGSFISLGSYRQPTSTKPPISPLFEESEPSGSRPLTPVSGTPNYQYPVSEESKSSVEDKSSVVNEHPRARLPSDAASLLPPSPLPATGHLSYQSHATAASRGSTVPRFSVEGMPATPPVSHPWAQVMNTKSDWEASKSIIPSLKAESEVSLASVAVVVSSGSDDNDKSAVSASASASAKPPSNTLSPFSLDSNSDIYSAIGRMSFPRPPGTTNSATDASSPVSTAPPRSNWVTGITLRTKGSRGSLKRKVEESPLTSPTAPSVPPLPTTVAASPMLQFSSASDEDVYYDSSTKESGPPSGGLTVPNESRASTVSGIAPSYDRRVSDLLRAAAERPKRDSIMSSQTDTTESIRDSVEGAVLGVARTASLTARAKALLKQPVSIVSTGREPSTLSYLVPSPHQSTLPSETSLPAATLEAQTPRTGMLDVSALPLQRHAYTQNYGLFPESVQSQSIEGGDDISLRRIYSSDVPNSALPLNQSTPFQSTFYQNMSPSAYRGPTDATTYNPEFTEPHLHRNNSKSSKRSRRGSVLSSITKASSHAAKSFSWLTRRSLPPVPRSPPRMPYEKELPNPDDDLTVPELAKRAAIMDHYLSVGELPYTSPTSSPYLAPHAYNSVHNTQRPIGRRSFQSVLSSFSNGGRAERIERNERERRFAGNSGFVSLPETQRESIFRSRVSMGSSLSIHRKKVAIFVFLAVIIIAIAIPVGVVLGKRAQHRSSVALCAGGVMTGASCELNSTCVCTSSVQGRCDPIAQSLLDLLPSANGLFGMNITKSDLALTMWDLKGQPTSNCAEQVILVDISPALNQTNSPNRTEWGRTAVLYNLFRTQDLAATETFRSSIAKADFSVLEGSDESITDDSKRIVFQVSGYVYDLSSMKFAPSAVSWTSDSGVDQSQIGRVGNTASNALDRMYSFAAASSVQRSTALTRYWTTVLGLSDSSLSGFMSALSKAAVLLPYDGISNSTATFLSENQQRDEVSFPPPVACLPAVPTTGRQNLGMIERNAFGLPQLGDAPGSLDTSCFPEHPIWGVLDVLRLRRPFDDSRTNMRIPTTQLTSDVASRVVLHTGEQIVGLTSPQDNGIALQGNFDILAADPRNYGTLQHMNHVALSYLQSFPNIQLAAKVAQYIINTNEDSTPEAPGGSLFTSADVLSSLPVIEVAVFGSILSTDVQKSRADFATPDGQLFFGSKQGDIFRKWALRNRDNSILWSDSSTASQVVHETTTTNTALEDIWQQATGLINNATAVGRATSKPEIDTIIAALNNASLFSSS